MKLRVRAFGLAVGIVWGLGIFVATLWDVAIGRGKTLQSLSSFFIGYHISISGAFLGLMWGFVYGFICGVLIAWMYNILHKALYKSEGAGA
jgi:hypothetical protein